MASQVEKSIVVNVPLDTAYNQWTQFEEFPKFMEGIEEVQQLNDKLTHWKVNIGGKRHEYDAEITEQVPDQVIAWRSTTSPYNAGRVSFQPEGTDSTRVTVVMEYEPEGVLEKVGDFLGAAERRIEGDLQRFKEFIESRRVETGAWRGEIH